MNRCRKRGKTARAITLQRRAERRVKYAVHVDNRTR